MPLREPVARGRLRVSKKDRVATSRVCVGCGCRQPGNCEFLYDRELRVSLDAALQGTAGSQDWPEQDHGRELRVPRTGHSRTTRSRGRELRVPRTGLCRTTCSPGRGTACSHGLALAEPRVLWAGNCVFTRVLWAGNCGFPGLAFRRTSCSLAVPRTGLSRTAGYLGRELRVPRTWA